MFRCCVTVLRCSSWLVTERGHVQALVNQKVRSLGRFEDAQQLAVLAGMLAEWSLVLQGRSPQVCLCCVQLSFTVSKQPAVSYPTRRKARIVSQ